MIELAQTTIRHLTGFQIEYLIFGSYVILSGLVMIAAYTATNPWWRSHLGRMMITYAAAEICMSLLLMITIEFQWSPHWFRIAWFALQTVVGTVLCYQTYTIVSLHRDRLRVEREQAEQVNRGREKRL